MSTRAVIARPTAKGWLGVYNHSDGYPTGLGMTLWNLHRRRYAGDIKKFHREIIDNNLDGWSQLHVFHPKWGKKGMCELWDGETTITVDQQYEYEAGDYRLPVSYKNDAERGSPELKRPPFNPRNIVESWCEWLYILRKDGLEVRSFGNWEKPVSVIPWDTEPLWASIENKAKEMW